MISFISASGKRAFGCETERKNVTWFGFVVVQVFFHAMVFEVSQFEASVLEVSTAHALAKKDYSWLSTNELKGLEV